MPVEAGIAMGVNGGKRFTGSVSPESDVGPGGGGASGVTDLQFGLGAGEGHGTQYWLQAQYGTTTWVDEVRFHKFDETGDT